jgi:hypothetical protein
MAKPIHTNYDFNNASRILNLPNPVAAQEPATKDYVDSAVEGLAWKDNVRVSTQSNINLASPGATIDGITMAASDRVLVRAQSTQSENGIYIWNGAATPMTRASDASTSIELENAVVPVDEGTDAGGRYRQTQVNFTLGSGNIIFDSFDVSVPNATETLAGKVELLTQAETDAGLDDTRVLTALKLANWSGRKLKFSTNVGDGSATQYDITHNLGTEDVKVEVYRNSGAKDSIDCEASRQSANVVRLNFNPAPTSNQFRVVILG